MSVTITDTDNGYKKRLADIRKMKGAYVKVGVPDTPRAEDGTPMDVVGAVHEFGNAHVPQRSFLRAWADEHEAEAQAKLADTFRDSDGDSGAALKMLGQWAIDGIRARIRSGIAPALNPTTVKRKSHAIPLIDTAQLIESITQEVTVQGVTHAHTEPEVESETEPQAVEGAVE